MQCTTPQLDMPESDGDGLDWGGWNVKRLGGGYYNGGTGKMREEGGERMTVEVGWRSRGGGGGGGDGLLGGGHAGQSQEEKIVVFYFILLVNLLSILLPFHCRCQRD